VSVGALKDTVAPPDDHVRVPPVASASALGLFRDLNVFLSALATMHFDSDMDPLADPFSFEQVNPAALADGATVLTAKSRWHQGRGCNRDAEKHSAHR
jgi:hypothetical protein